MTDQEYADFNNYPICGDVRNFIKLLASIAERITPQEVDDASDK